MNDRIVSFDFGLKKIGVATGNQTTGTTQALNPIAAKQGAPDWKIVDKIVRMAP